MQQIIIIQNKTGLHARPAAAFVQTASKFKSIISLETEGRKVDAKSIMGVMSLGAGQGKQLVLKAEGEDAEEALKALTELIGSKFGEE